MPSLVHTFVTVATTPTLLITKDKDGSMVKIGNSSGKIVYMGDANVTTANGLELRNNTVETFEFSPNTSIYGVVSNGTGSVAILEY